MRQRTLSGKYIESGVTRYPGRTEAGTENSKRSALTLWMRRLEAWAGVRPREFGRSESPNREPSKRPLKISEIAYDCSDTVNY